MKQSDILQREYANISHKQTQGLDPLFILKLVIKHWYIYVITILVALYAARFYINHTMLVYRSSTTLLINLAGERAYANNEELLQGLGLPASMRNLDNQIYILKSRELSERTLNELPFEIDYYYRTVRNFISLYPNSPIKVVLDSKDALPQGVEFSLSYIGDNVFVMESETEAFPFKRSASFGESIPMPEGNFRIIALNEEWFNANKGKQLLFVVNTQNNLIRSYSGRLNVELISRSGSILRVSLTGTSPLKDIDFLNKLTEIFQYTSLERKNFEANRRIQFIDDQLVGISDSLLITENRLQQFRSAHRVMDLSAQGQAIISQVMLLENERARLELESNYYDYLADYLSKDVSGELPIVPITMGINDPGLTNLVTTLADLQGQLLSRPTGEMNPLQGLLAQRVRNTKDALKETLNGLRRANSLAMAENQKQIARINSQASALPATERQLLGFERKFRLNDELYTFLLQMRSEQQMQKASNMPDSEVIDSADPRYSIIVAPNRTLIYLIGLLAGSGLPFMFFFLSSIFNKKLDNETIIRMTNLPIIGNIPRNPENTKTVVFDYPNSSIAESYRLMRSRLQFFIKDDAQPVILVTSSMPEDGKTYTAVNLASVYSLLGKKTILVGFDLRKPRLYQEFKLNNDKGVSTWLIGRDSIEEIVQNTDYENLFVITGGPVPPNQIGRAHV